MNDLQKDYSLVNTTKDLDNAVANYKQQLLNVEYASKQRLESINTINQDRQYSKDAVVSDSELETASGIATNLGITLSSKTLQQLGNIASMVPTAVAEGGLASGDITPEELVTYRSVKDKQSRLDKGENVEWTDEELSLMQPWIKDTSSRNTQGSILYGTQKPKLRETEFDPLRNEAGTKEMSPKFDILETYFQKKEHLDALDEVFNAGEKYVNTKKTTEGFEQGKKAYTDNVGKITEGFDKITNDDMSGISDLVEGVSDMSVDSLMTLLQNPQATGQVIVESIPAMVTAARSLPLATGATGINNYNDALDKFEEEYGDIPVGDERARTQALSALSGVIAAYSDKVLAQGGALVPKAVKSVTPRVATGTVSEGIAESSEQALTELAGTKEGDDIDGSEVFVSGLFGAGSGGAISGVVSTTSKLNDTVKSIKTSQEAKAVTKAVTNNGTAKEVDLDNSVIEDEQVQATTKGADLTKASGIAKVLRNATTLMNREDVSQETKDEATLLAKYSLGTVESRIDNANEVITELDSLIEESQKNDPEADITPLVKTKKETQAELKRLEKVKKANESVVNANYDAISNDRERVESIKTRLGSLDEGLDNLANEEGQFEYTSTKAADRDAATLVNASINNDLVSSEDLVQASSNPQLSPQRATNLKQNAELNEEFTKTADVVHNDIVQGGEGFIGLRQYQQRVNDLINLGSYQAANQQAGKAQNFANHLDAKANAYSKALEEAQNSPKGTRVGVQGFNKLDGSPVTLDANAGKLVEQVRADADLALYTANNLKEQVTNFTTPVSETVQEEATTETQEETPVEETVSTEENVQEGSETTQEASEEVTEEVQKETTVTQSASDEELLSVHNLEPESNKDITTLDAKEELESRGYEFDEEGSVKTSPKVTEPNAVLDSVNTGVEYQGKKKYSDADKKFLNTNQIGVVFKRKIRGLFARTNLNDQKAVEEALGRELLPSEVSQLTNINKFKAVFNNTFNSIVRPVETILKDRQWQHRRPIEYFTQEDGSYSQEFKDILSISASEFLEENASQLSQITPTGIASLLGLDTTNFTPTNEQLVYFRNAGSPANDVIRQLGSIVLKNLGLSKNPESSINVQNNIEIDLGKAVLNTLTNIGVIEVTTFTGTELNALGASYTNENISLKSVKVNFKVLDKGLGLDAQELFGKLNSFTASLTGKQVEPKKAEIGERTQKVSNSVRRSGGQVAPKEFVEGANNYAEVPHHVDQNMDTVFNSLGDDFIAEMLGEKAVKGTIKGLKPKVEGKNQTVRRDIRTYKEFIARMVEETGNKMAPFFYNYRFGKQYRLSAIGSDINYQTSKLHRYLTAIKPSKVDISSPDNMSFVVFKLGVAQGMGIDIDKFHLSKSLYEFEKLVSNPVIDQAVDSLVTLLNGQEITEDQKTNLQEAIALGGENTHSLKSLTGLAEMRMTEGTTFDSTITYEIDGITNGPFNAHIQMGLEVANGKLTSDSQHRAAQGGMFLDGTESYTDWISDPANWDMYQSTAAATYQYEEEYLESADDKETKEYQILKKYVGDIVVLDEDTGEVAEVTSKGRKLTKNPITVTVYAAGERSISDKIAGAIRENMLEALQEAYETGNTQKQLEIAQDLTYLTGFNTRSTSVIDFEFKPNMVNTINRLVSTTLGSMVNSAIKDNFTTQKTNTDLVTNSSNLIFDMFNAMYQKAVKDKLSNLREEGKLSSYEYLTQQQLDEVKSELLHTMPVYKMFYGDAKNGVMTASVTNSHTIPDEMKSLFTVEKDTANGSESTSYLSTYEAPNASTVAMLNIASGDATTMARAGKKGKGKLGLNVFDAWLTRIEEVVDGSASTALNTSAYEAVAYHSILKSVSDRFSESMASFEELDIEGLDLTSLKQRAYVESTENTFLKGEVVYVRDTEGKTTKVREEVIDEVTISEIKILLENMLAKLKLAASKNTEAKQALDKELTFNQFEAIGTGVKYNKGKVVSGTETTPEMLTSAITKAEEMLVKVVNTLPENSNVDQTIADTESKVTPTTNTGVLHKESEAVISNIFKGKTETTLTEVKEQLLNAVTDPARKEIYRTLITLIEEKGSVNIKILRGTDNHDVVFSTGKQNTDTILGYHDPNTNTIYINDEYKPVTGMHEETIFHELLHRAVDGSLHGALEQVRTGVNYGYTAQQVKAAKQIQDLYNKLKTEGFMAGHPAMENVFELVAWGITNQDTTSQLASIRTRAKAIKTRIVALVRNMLGLPKTRSTALLDLVDNAMYLATTGNTVESSLTKQQPTSPQKAQDKLKTLNLRQMYDVIADTNTEAISSSHDTYLKETLDEAVNKAIDPTLLVIKDENKSLASEDALLIGRLDPSIKHNLNTLDLLGFRMSDQEAFVFGMYSHVIDSALNDFGWNTKEIRRMYEYAKKNMSYQDFLSDDARNTPEDVEVSVEAAQARYDAVFNNIGNQGINDYLRNFMALATTNEAFRERLENLTVPKALDKKIKGNNVRETLDNIMNLILNWINDFAITRSHEPNVKAKLDKLAKNIRHKQLRERGKLEKKAIQIATFSSKYLNKINTWGKQRIDLVLNGAKKKYKERVLLNAAVNLSGMVLSEAKADQFAIGLDLLQNASATGRESFMSAVWSELKGTNASNQKIHQLLAIKNKMIDQENVHIKQNIARLINEGFEKPLEDKDSESLTKAVLKTDLSSLVQNGYDLDQVQELLQDPEKLRNEINTLQAQLRQVLPTELYYYFTNSGKALSEYMARGTATVDEMVFNTDAIVSLHGTGRADPKVNEDVRKAVDSLISLEALRLTKLWQRRRVAKLLDSEGKRTNGENGVGFIIAMHNNNKKESLEKNFKGSEHNFQKGYTKEIIDPYKSIQIAPASAQEELEMQGYVKVDKAPNRDANDPIKEPMFMYISDYGGDAAYLQGILSTANKGAKGFSIIDSYTQSGNPLPAYAQPEVIASIAKNKKANMESLFTNNPKKVFNPLVATTNKSGNAVDYRYVMSEDQKDNLLRKDNRVDEVLGSMVSGITLKVNSEDINNQLIEALGDQYQDDKDNNNLDKYVLVEQNSKDKELAQIWNLLPEEAKVKAKNVFGKEGIYVRNDLVNVAFGYRKWSVAELWNPDNEYPKLIKDLAVKMVSGVYGKKIASYVVRGERGLQELVKELKDIVVIKSVVVMIGNMVSNTVQLPVLHGVNPVKAISDQITAFTAASEYRKNAREIFDLQTKINIGKGTAAMEQRVNELVQDQQRNPVKPLMDAGMLQTIIDDSGEQDSIYSYRHSLTSKLSTVTSFIPEGIVEGAKQLTLQQGSIGYDALSQATQLSDFAARYALYNHQIKNEGTSHEDAITNIVDAFINYDLPPHKAMQYMNDMGITWFFKYFIRIQKVLIKGFRERPARILALMVGQNMLGTDIDNPVNSFFPSVDITRKIGLVDGIDMATNSHPIAQFY